jgi:hypothetical protein
MTRRSAAPSGRPCQGGARRGTSRSKGAATEAVTRHETGDDAGDGEGRMDGIKLAREEDGGEGGTEGARAERSFYAEAAARLRLACDGGSQRQACLAGFVHGCLP